MSFLSNFLGSLSGNVRNGRVGEPDRVVAGANRSQGYGDQTNDAFAHTKTNKYSFGSLVYPKELETDANYGHYMLFYIYRSFQSKYKDDSENEISTEANVGSSQQGEFNPTLRNTNIYEQSNSVKRFLGYKKTSDAIALYMPPDLKFKYESEYRNTELGFAGQLVKDGYDVIERIQSNAPLNEIISDVAGKAGDAAKTLFGEKIAKELGGSIAEALGGGDVRGTINLVRNKALNPHLEAVFEKVGFRTFNYTFRFTPKSEDEVKTVHQIIHKFKFHMLPERSDNGHFLIYPSEFEIHFMYKGAENVWIPFVSHCVLNSVDVDYGGDQYQTFRPVKNPRAGGAESPAPSTITMTLTFTENEIMTKEMIERGF